MESTERIVKVSGRLGWLIDQITFTTNEPGENTRGPYGGTGGYEFERKPLSGDAYLAYITGTVYEADYLPVIRDLTFVWDWTRK